MMVFLGKRILIGTSIVILVWLGIGIFMYTSASFQFSNNDNKILSDPLSATEEMELCLPKEQGFWRKADLHKRKIPQSVRNEVSMITVQSASVPVQSVQVHYLYAKPNKPSSSNITLLLLHGQSYSSETWNELGTLRMVAAFGFYPIAIDLPGFGKTPKISNLNRAYFVDDLITALKLHKPVLVSPSMSGSFALEFLIHNSEKLGGFIPVSPVGTKVLDGICQNVDSANDVPLNDDCQRVMHYLKSKDLNLNCIEVPTLIVYGERDKGENSAKLCLLPESQGAEIPEGSHAAYKSNPELWHKLLYNFLKTLSEMHYCT